MLPGLDIPKNFSVGRWPLNYQADFLDSSSADRLFKELLARKDWHQPQIRIHGKQVPVPRLVAWEGDNGIDYSYSGVTHSTTGWHPALSALRDKVEDCTGHRFNFALLNLYRDGQDAMGWHRDNEVELGENPMVASISLGAERDFHLRNKPGAPLQNIRLQHGSLLLMPGKIMHHLPRRKGVGDPRINISLRCVVDRNAN